MFYIDQESLALIKDNHLNYLLYKGSFGLEKENVRVSKEGQLALSPHPFKDRETHPYITTDFSESQVEMVTPPMKSPKEAIDFLETLHNIVSIHLKDEFLWPQSLPPILPEADQIPIAQFRSYENNLKSDNPQEYREQLAKKYGVRKQLISGIHYNFSFEESLIKELHHLKNPSLEYRQFKDRLYMRVLRNMTKMSWMLIHLIGSSPAADASFKDYCGCCITPTRSKEEVYSKAISLRNGQCGYRNLIDLPIPLDSLDSYIKGLKKQIEEGRLISSKEYYSVIRPKNSQGGLEALEENGIEYLELRLLDLNPLYPIGISLEDVQLVHLFFMVALLLQEDDNPNLLKEAIDNNRTMADLGLENHLTLSFNQKKGYQSEWASDLFDLFQDFLSEFGSDQKEYQRVLDIFRQKNDKPNLLYSRLLLDKLKKEGFIGFHLRKAREYLDLSRLKQFNFIGHEAMELSTQILLLDAIRRGVKISLLDEGENFIKLSKGERIEYIKQATKTSLDSYSSVLVMENKQITKGILKDGGIIVPRGAVYTNKEEALAYYRLYKDHKIVVKPNTTNFGLGITIFLDYFTQDDYLKAIDMAFKEDKTVLVEHYVPGNEYRIIVIKDEVCGVLHRIPANVVGDGASCISQLIDQKNQNPLRGEGYRRPLEKIKKTEAEALFLKQQGLSFDSVLPEGETIFLRRNSNISTGGDSIDYTDCISQTLKQVAIKAASLVGASIVGVDLMTEDISSDKKDDYAIIELNFNPAIHIHCYPLIGENRHLGDKILDALGFY